MSERHESSEELNRELAKLAPKTVRALGGEAIQQNHDKLVRLKRNMRNPETRVHPQTPDFIDAELSFFQPLIPYIEFDDDEPPLLDLHRDEEATDSPL